MSSRFTVLPLSQRPSAGARVYAVRPPNFLVSRSDVVVVICWEALTRVVVNRKKDLHEMWHSRA